MSLVPLLFRDWWDDFDRDRPSRLVDQHFGLGLKRDDLFNSLSSLSTPLIRPGRYFRPWAESLARSNSGSSNIQVDDKQFQVSLPLVSLFMQLHYNLRAKCKKWLSSLFWSDRLCWLRSSCMPVNIDSRGKKHQLNHFLYSALELLKIITRALVLM